MLYIVCWWLAVWCLASVLLAALWALLCYLRPLRWKE
jgi:hypothetical protein